MELQYFFHYTANLLFNSRTWSINKQSDRNHNYNTTVIFSSDSGQDDLILVSEKWNFRHVYIWHPGCSLVY